MVRSANIAPRKLAQNECRVSSRFVLTLRYSNMYRPSLFRDFSPHDPHRLSYTYDPHCHSPPAYTFYMTSLNTFIVFVFPFAFLSFRLIPLFPQHRRTLNLYQSQQNEFRSMETGAAQATATHRAPPTVFVASTVPARSTISVVTNMRTRIVCVTRDTN